MRKTLRGLFLIIALSAGLGMCMSTVNTVVGCGMTVSGAGSSKIPDTWEGVAMFAVFFAVSLVLAGLFASESLASYYADHRSVQVGTVALVIALCLQIRTCYYLDIYDGELPWAVSRHDLSEVRELLREGEYTSSELDRAWAVAVNTSDQHSAELLAARVVSEGDTCLALARAIELHPFVVLLVDAGADPAACPDRDLFDQAMVPWREDFMRTVELLHQRGVRPGQRAQERLRAPDPENELAPVRALLGWRAEDETNAPEPIPRRDVPEGMNPESPSQDAGPLPRSRP